MLTLDNEPITHFKTKNDFSMYIERYAIERGVSLLTAILQYCEDADVDIKRCVSLIGESLKQKVEEEAVADKYITRKTTIQFFG